MRKPATHMNRVPVIVGTSQESVINNMITQLIAISTEARILAEVATARFVSQAINGGPNRGCSCNH